MRSYVRWSVVSRSRTGFVISRSSVQSRPQLQIFRGSGSFYGVRPLAPSARTTSLPRLGVRLLGAFLEAEDLCDAGAHEQGGVLVTERFLSTAWNVRNVKGVDSP